MGLLNMLFKNNDSRHNYVVVNKSLGNSTEKGIFIEDSKENYEGTMAFNYTKMNLVHFGKDGTFEKFKLVSEDRTFLDAMGLIGYAAINQRTREKVTIMVNTPSTREPGKLTISPVSEPQGVRYTIASEELQNMIELTSGLPGL